MELIKKIENMSKALSAQFAIIGTIVFALTVAIIFFDVQFAFLSQFPRPTVRSVAKTVAKIAIVASFLAVAYYLLREMYLQARKRKLALSAVSDAFVKACISGLRYLHPLFGVCALSLLLVHAYIMFSGWRGPIAHPRVYSGVAALLFISALAILGLKLRQLPAQRMCRSLHRYLAAGFILSYVVHKSL
ncbi:MAG: hypothetical protein K0Q77_2872 [Anaerosporomusa subterranea]|jgi:hypothetical protein|nr:hypothetical protein [Anaerosporomusa subterranea]